MTRAPRSTAVMAQKAPSEVEGDDPQTALYRKLNFFPTPPWAARAGAELILSIDPFADVVWEPACGEGRMARPLAEYFARVIASDVHPYGFGEVIDFLGDIEGGGPEADWIVTNPPFAIAADFLRLALGRARRGVALLLRLAFLEGGERYPLLYGARPITVFAPFIERVPMALGRWDPELSSATAYGWFVWDKQAPVTDPVIRPIAPGARDRLWHGGDAARFGAKRDAPLLDAMEA